MPVQIDCFKAYDIRGRIPDQLNADIAYRIGNATVEYLNAGTIVVGRDIRLSSDELADALARGITDAGADVLDIGLCGTEVVYFATGDLEADGGIMITASHNPADYNGLKLVREQSKPISADTGLMDIRDIAEGDERSSSDSPGRRTQVDVSNRYVDRLLSFIDPDKLKPLKIVGNPGNGGAKLALDLLEPRLPFEFVKVHYEPDGTFPNGVPNPMLEENRGSTIDAIKESGADFGIACPGGRLSGVQRPALRGHGGRPPGPGDQQRHPAAQPGGYGHLQAVFRRCCLWVFSPFTCTVSHRRKSWSWPV